MDITSTILDMLTCAKNVDDGVNSVLQYLGRLWKISRIYIFETTEDGYVVNNTYEWCAAGIEPMIDRLQNMSLVEYGYDSVFAENDMFTCPDINELAPAAREVLEAQGICAVAWCAIREHGVFRGFIGLDDCTGTREDWRADSAESRTLRYVSRLFSMYLMKERSLERLDAARKKEREQAARLAEERTQYRDALVKNAAYSFHFDVTDGNLNEEILGRNGESWMPEAGLSIPCDYDVQCEVFKKRFGVEFLDREAEDTFSRAGLLGMFASGMTSGYYEYYQKTTDDYTRVLLLLSKDAATGHVLASVFCFDITKAKKEKLEKQRILREALAQAERANRAKTNFLNNMSHDIRTPMNAILGFTSLALARADDPEKMADYLKKIRTSGSHLLDLIDDVLDMRRIEAGEVKIEETETSLSALLRDVRNIVEADARAGQLKLSFDMENVTDQNVWCDCARLKRVLLNCMDNAVKFTPAGGKVWLKITQVPCSAKGRAGYEFRIRDTGIGMSPGFVGHVFEPFERERTSTISGVQGTGLGMPIAKSIVDMMGGTIRAGSEQGKGSEFIISLTLRPVAAKNTCAGLSDPEGALRGVRILLVEDNDMNREIAWEILRSLGALVESAADGAAAVERLAEAGPEYYDIVLMDVQMPVMDGYTATRRIRELSAAYADLPIIAMTANAFEEDRKTVFASGMDGYIAKPVSARKMIDTICEALQRRRRNR